MKKLMLIASLAGSLLTVNPPANANAYHVSSASKITFLAAYGSHRTTAPGDIYIKLSNPAPACSDGYYILGVSPGRDALLEFALSAYHNSKQIVINGFDSPKWRGSAANNTCEIEGIYFANY